jgi:DNA-binding Lrp family transcriptional regulator
VLHYLLCRLYDEGRGQLVNARLTLAQTTLSKKLGISRQWIGELVSRLEREGWLEHSSLKLPNGTNSSTIFRAGRMLKRLLVMLSKSRRGENRGNKPAKGTWHFSPRELEKRILSIRSKEKEPPRSEVLARIPMLKRWLERGSEKTEGKNDSFSSS